MYHLQHNINIKGKEVKCVLFSDTQVLEVQIKIVQSNKFKIYIAAEEGVLKRVVFSIENIQTTQSSTFDTLDQEYDQSLLFILNEMFYNYSI